MKNHEENNAARSNASRAGAMLAISLCAAGLIMVTAMVFAEVPEKPESGLARMGGTLYRGYCTSCHGAKGKGDGPIAESLVVAPADLTQLAKKDGEFPYDRVMKRIDGREKVAAHGSQDMPVWGDVLQAAEGGADETAVARKVTALTHYVWTIQADNEAGR